MKKTNSPLLPSPNSLRSALELGFPKPPPSSFTPLISPQIKQKKKNTKLSKNRAYLKTNKTTVSIKILGLGFSSELRNSRPELTTAACGFDLLTVIDQSNSNNKDNSEEEKKQGKQKKINYEEN